MSDPQSLEQFIQTAYIQPGASKLGKKEILAGIEFIHERLTKAGISAGDEKGAYTLFFRICALIAERDAALQELNPSQDNSGYTHVRHWSSK